MPLLLHPKDFSFQHVILETYSYLDVFIASCQFVQTPLSGYLI